MYNLTHVVLEAFSVDALLRDYAMTRGRGELSCFKLYRYLITVSFRCHLYNVRKFF